MIASDNSPAKVCKLVLVRHEHTDMAGTFCGQIDPSLSALGRAHLKYLAQSLSGYPLHSVYSSDLRRARQTAVAIAAALRVPLQLRVALRELAFGEWEGLGWKQVVARDPAFAQRWLDGYPSVAAPGGERFDDFVARVHQVRKEIAADVQHGCAAIVTHAGVIRTLLASVTLECGTPVDLTASSYGSWWEIWKQNRRWVLHARSASLHPVPSEERVVVTRVGA